MATKITTGLIDSGAITSALIGDASITADDLHTSLDLTGKTVTVATATAGDNDTTVASTAFVSTAIANLADSAPSTLDTLNELAAALGDDANFSTTVTNSIATKLPLAGGTMTGALTVTGDANPALEISRGSANTTNVNLKYNTTLTGQLSAANAEFQISAAGSSTPMEFFTNGSERMRIDSSGDIFAKTADARIGSDIGAVEYGTSTSNSVRFYSADTERMRITSAGNVGIGNTSPLGKLTISYPAGANAPTTVTAANTYLQLGSDDYGAANNGKFMIGFGYTDATNTNSPAYIGYEETSTSGDTKGVLTFYTRDVITDTAPTERMRIDSSGNLLVGQQTASSGTVGTSIRADGRTFFCADGNYAAHFNRNTSNGDIAHFAKNDNIVGSIGVVSDDRMYFTTADGLGLQFDKDNNRIVPCDAAGAYNNNVELGDSSLEFTNLWLSGTANIGSTAELKSGTNGTTSALRFVTTDNVDTSKFIRMSSYYMEYSGNSNEGHHFIDSASTSLLKVFGNTNSGYPRRIGMGTETPAGKLHVATGLESNNVYITTGASGGTGYDVSLNMLGGANNSEMLINLGIDGDADRNQIKSYQGNLYFRANNSQRYHITSAGRHVFWGTHQGDSTGHFMFTNQGFDSSGVNNSLVVQNSHTFLQFMAWTSNGARIGTRVGGWSATGSQGTYLVAADATNIICTSGGSPTLSNGTGITSDERLKENISDINDGQLAKINALRPRNFTWKDSRKSGNMEGFIAQEVESIIPEAVEEREVAPDPTDTSRDFEGDVKVIKHEVINARLIKAIQELSAKLEAAEARIATLEG